jgi:formylmethanofuran dehydrogenase subunit E
MTNYIYGYYTPTYTWPTYNIYASAYAPKPKTPEGHCTTCQKHFPELLPNQSDGTLLCHNCSGGNQ